MVNAVSIAGYVEIFDYAYIGAFTIVHQYVRIGSYSICGMLTKPAKDVPPFMMVDGNPALVRGINAIGHQHGKQFVRILYRSGYSVPHALEEFEKYKTYEEIKLLIDFIKNSSRCILLKSTIT